MKIEVKPGKSVYKLYVYHTARIKGKPNPTKLFNQYLFSIEKDIIEGAGYDTLGKIINEEKGKIQESLNKIDESKRKVVGEDFIMKFYDVLIEKLKELAGINDEEL